MKFDTSRIFRLIDPFLEELGMDTISIEMSLDGVFAADSDGIIHVPHGAMEALNDYELILNLTHELRHLYQYNRKWLECSEIHLTGEHCFWETKWKGKAHRMHNRLVIADTSGLHYRLIGSDIIQCLTTEEYEQLPWEVDAENYAKKCVKKYYKRLNN